MIKEAAILRVADRKVWTGRRHGNCINLIVAETGTRPIGQPDFIQGFVTDDGRFVDRKEAWKIALANNQILNLEDPYGWDPAKPEIEGTLMSEDLY